MSLPPLNKRSLPKSYLLIAATFLLLLSFVSAFYFRSQPSTNQERKALQKYIQRQQHDFDKVIRDSVLMRKLVQQKETLDNFKEISKKEYGLFLFAETLSDVNQILFWSNQKVIPPDDDFVLPDGEYFQRLGNGYYVVEKKTIRLSGLSNNVVAFCIIPVELRYDKESEYFFNHFVYSSDAERKIKISEAKTNNPVFGVSGKPLFYIDHKVHSLLPSNDTATIILRLAGFLLFLIFIHFVAEAITRKKGIFRGLLFLTVALVAIRLGIFLLPFVFYFRQFTLFDPTIFAANIFNPSLGDLLINSVLFCWLVVFAWFHIGYRNKISLLLKGSKLFVAGLVAAAILVWFTFQLALIIRSLVIDSKISFYVTDFFSLTIYTVVGFIILALLSLAFYYLSRLLLQVIYPAFRGKTIYVYFAVTLLGLAFLTFYANNKSVLFLFPVLLWLIVYILLLTQQKLIINRFRITVAGILFWIFIFSFSLSTLLLFQNKVKELREQKALADKYVQLTNPSDERTLSIGLRYLDQRFLQNNFERFLDKERNLYLRDSIANENSSNQFGGTFNTKIYVFDSTEQGVNNNDPMSYMELNNILAFRSKPTAVPNLFYHETSFDQFTYITKIDIPDTAGFKGSFFMIATPKKYNEETLDPEVLGKRNKNDAENSSLYAFAVYFKNKLILSSSKYSFKTDLDPVDIPKHEFEERLNNDYLELWNRASNENVVVVAKKRDTLIESITLFSYLFCSFLLMILLFRILALFLKAGSDRSLFRNFWHVNIRSQVHNTIIFISILSFLIIGAATISFFINRYNLNNIDRLSRTSAIMLKEMQKRTGVFASFDDLLKVQDSVSKYNLQKIIDEVADIHNVAVNVYDLKGDLRVSSKPLVYRSGILSTKMHPEAYYHLHRLRQIQYVQKEKLSELSYLSIYSAVRDTKGDVYAYINIPYFLSQIELNQEISNFLVTIINLNAFIFLISGVIALFITNRITRSFSIIGDKMKDITLGRTNEEIEWNRDDEIGELVKYYNKMVHQLEESADALAKSEREGAWREMARQVAHEIKNPLTPMKLSIQYLQKAIVNNQPNVKELTASVANTLVEQIDHLSRIAADFARFANIGNRNNELFDLHPVLESLYSLYGANPKVELKWNRVEEPIQINADKTQMNRLFSNLLSNAVDACASQEKCSIVLLEEIEDNTLLIKITDNGEGIPVEMQPKIFTPNFTTKTSGTGLGLAMCKSIVEQAGGRIWFETEPGKGTTFFVSLPLAD